MINKKLKRFPHLADLQAIKAIQQFNDSSQSGLSGNKLEVLHDPLIRITKALYNEGVSIFNSNWFITIYIKYLEIIREQISREFKIGKNSAHPEVRRASEKLYLKLLKLPRLLQIKNNAAGLTALNAKLKDTSILTATISSLDLKRACQAIVENDPGKIISDGKTANSIVFVMLTLNSLYARIPILKELAKKNLNNIPDLNRDLILQKQMIINISDINDFLMALAVGNKESAKVIANKTYDQSLRTIDDYLENAFLKKPHEVDPFLKAVWIVKESRNIFDEHVNRNRLKKAHQLLRIVMKERCQHKASVETAINYRNELITKMSAYE
ncbi:MAG: hypothetical protein HN945_15450 [Deltaproteobacteria bacterium]|nr:hypothetical protein [Deltaproteobacteria bacterium]MBT4644688.1 hypothetical protein [Deltaproteobacteria bacterium]MBT6614410.1 hypothetical protein [Deltaproteobacteria bacterium]MBT7153831.1 hypothetical protein [Deltaproteobacteria bacterium]MBT7711399.1 hypothetical protein [Deltaproteobacteria bacterium]